MKTGIISDPTMLEHKTTKNHPECPERLTAILNALEKANIFTHPHIDYVQHISREVSNAEIALVHTEKYIQYIASIWPQDSKRTQIAVFDSYISPLSHTAALLSLGGTLEAVDHIMNGTWQNGYAVVRPPGHHSGFKNNINGFCIFNNVAIAAKYIRQKYNLTKIAIFDWDIHHGDGTQHIFTDDKDTLFISIHRHDEGKFYPGGPYAHFQNCGTNQATGSKINIPLSHSPKFPYQTPGDNEYIYIFNRMIGPILHSFEPQFILVSGGFDAARHDPLGDFTLTPNGYFYLTRKLTEIQSKCLVVLEGGYNLNSIGEASCAVVNGLLRERDQLPEPIESITLKNIHLHCFVEKEYHQQIDAIADFYSKYHPCLEEGKEYMTKIKENKTKCFGTVEEEEQVIVKKPCESRNTFVMAGGHIDSFKTFTTQHKYVYKKAKNRETAFYERNDVIESKFTPKYYGMQKQYIVLENLLYEMEEYIILDIKLSNQMLNPYRDIKKDQEQREKSLTTTAGKYLFKLTGYTTPTFKETKIKSLEDEEIITILARVIDRENKGLFIQFIQQLISALREINKIFFQTSLLLIKGKNKSKISWIDFSYWYQHETYDQNTIIGLQNILKFIHKIQ